MRAVSNYEPPIFTEIENDLATTTNTKVVAGNVEKGNLYEANNDYRILNVRNNSYLSEIHFQTGQWVKVD
jgi:hypothetical protein